MTRDPVGAPIRAVVVDDSATARELLVAVLQESPNIEVVGVGVDGQDAVRLTCRMKPDILLIDVDMPVLDGLEATRRIMREQPTPIVLVTGSLMDTDVTLGFKALQAGALTVLTKPGILDTEACAELVRTVLSMGRVPVVRRWGAGAGPALRSPSSGSSPKASSRATSEGSRETRSNSSPLGSALFGGIESRVAGCAIAGIAASTGGPAALARILEPLPAGFPIPIVIVQHVTNGFAPGLAEWLDSTTALAVKLGSHGDDPRPGTVLVAPDDYHMGLNRRRQIELSKAPPYQGLRPSANYLFRALADTYGDRALGIILTGMGDDGAEGLVSLHRAGGVTLAQDRLSCVVYGMPGAAVRHGAIDAEISLDEIAGVLVRRHAARHSTR